MSPVSPGAMTFPGPRSRSSLRSVRSDSGTWDQLVEAIISAEPARESRVFDDIDEEHEPTIEEADEDIAAHPAANGNDNSRIDICRDFNEDRHHTRHQACSSMDASTIINDLGTEQGSIKRESAIESMPTTARASTVEEIPSFRFSIKLSDDLDTKLKLPEDSYLSGQHTEHEAIYKEARLSRCGSHSGSSTVNEQPDDTDPSKYASGTGDIEVQNEQEVLGASKAPFSAFPTKAKRFIVLSAASASIFAPLSMQIYLPSLTTLIEDFDVSRTKINLTVSVYMIFMAISPMIMGGIADVVGRRPTMLVCFAVYMVSCIMIALCDTYTELMGFRILQSIGASPLIAIASAVVADIVTSAERGSYAALVAVPVIFAPTLGPVIGGLLTQYLGWRSIFWFLLIAGGLGFMLIGLFFPETCRIIVGDASAKSPKRYRSAIQVFKDKRPDYSQSAADEKARLRGKGGLKAMLWTSLTSAVRVLFTKERFFLLVYVGLVFSGFQAIATELPTQFKATYGYDSVMIGVMYLPLASGAMISTVVFGKQMNKNFRKYALRAGVNIEAGQEVDMNLIDVERARLEITMPSLLISTAGIVCWGWVLEANTTIAAPCVLLFFMGVGLNGVMATTNALLMDISQSQAGAVMAASNLTRCALGAVASAVVEIMIENIGRGWSYVVFGLVFLLFSPLLMVHYFKGHQWRQQAKAKEESKNSSSDETKQACEGRLEDPPQISQPSLVHHRRRRPRFFHSKSEEVSNDAAATETRGKTAAIPLVEMTNKDNTSTS